MQKGGRGTAREREREKERARERERGKICIIQKKEIAINYFITFM